MRYLLLALALVACSDSTGPISSPVKAWSLQSVDGQPLPFVLLAQPLAGCGVTVRGGQFDLRENGTYSTLIEFGDEIDGRLYCNASYTDVGTYTVAGNQVTLRSATGHSRMVTLGSGTMTQIVESRRYVYH